MVVCCIVLGPFPEKILSHRDRLKFSNNLDNNCLFFPWSSLLVD